MYTCLKLSCTIVRSSSDYLPPHSFGTGTYDLGAISFHDSSPWLSFIACSIQAIFSLSYFSFYFTALLLSRIMIAAYCNHFTDFFFVSVEHFPGHMDNKQHIQDFLNGTSDLSGIFSIWLAHHLREFGKKFCRVIYVNTTRQ